MKESERTPETVGEGSCPSQEAAAKYEFARIVAAGLIVLCSITVLALPKFFGFSATELLTQTLAVTEDIPLAPIFLATFLLRPVAKASSITISSDRLHLVAILSLTATLLVGWAGNYLVFHGLPLSRDEQLAIFDQGIIRHGHLMWPIPVEWRTFADALNRRFMLPLGHREYWVSAYLPFNATFRALVGSVADPALASPLMTMLGALSLWRISRKLWPESNGTILVALLLYISSSQIIITSMTAFAMSMHLALNLLWLWLFLEDRPAAHVIALAIGFVATGIHQPLFHPLFAAPFFLLLVRQRRWRMLAIYLSAYLAIGIFWLGWPLWLSTQVSLPATPIHCGNSGCTSGTGFVERLSRTFAGLGWENLGLTAANLLRFICWQHPLLLPLAIFGAVSCWRSDRLVLPLALSFLLPILTMAILLPWQGHGWGYRYLHPVLGNAMLIAGYGYRELEHRVSLKRPIIVTTALALILLPVHALMAAKVRAPFERVTREIEAVPADVVIVDADVVPYGEDTVINKFDLSNRPKVLIASLVEERDLTQLCRGRTISFFSASGMAPIGRLLQIPDEVAQQPSAHFLDLERMAARLGCRMTAAPTKSQ